MALWLLGTSGAVPDSQRDYVGLVVEHAGRLILIEAGGSPLHRLSRMGLDPARLEGVFLSHRHPDHLGALPLLLMGLWLRGRTHPLWIAGPEDAVERARVLLELFEWRSWSGMFPVNWRPIPLEPGAVVEASGEIRLVTAPVSHSVPTLALRLELPEGVAVYSADTAPCPETIRLARGADVLIHEATGPYPGHAPPEGAGWVAREAGVRRLVLVHVPPEIDPEEWKARAREAFAGPVEVGWDGMRVL
ncbi:Ribonuclease BN [Candidatus Thermoflexus japonica]|uniref:Ribonuclease BN n=1 Tax=Candidatus Thermoflexus japonica TaxID=2035417 RepID=A0A2H5Y365_9CHLR|nr:Ribonuclease BN [Candidatus Thermoflexus japonica]